MRRSPTGRSSITTIGAALICLAAVGIVCRILATDSESRQLRELLATYLAEPAESSDHLEKDNRMILLIRRVEPLDEKEKVDAVLDIYLYFDAPGNRAQFFAHEALLNNGPAVLPVARERLDALEDPAALEKLIAEIEHSLPPEEADSPRDPADPAAENLPTEYREDA
jgi:hypothetical protein